MVSLALHLRGGGRERGGVVRREEKKGPEREKIWRRVEGRRGAGAARGRS